MSPPTRGSSFLYFHHRFYKGIPAQAGGKVWVLILDVHNNKAQNLGKYMVWL